MYPKGVSDGILGTFTLENSEQEVLYAVFLHIQQDEKERGSELTTDEVLHFLRKTITPMNLLHRRVYRSPVLYTLMYKFLVNRGVNFEYTEDYASNGVVLRLIDVIWSGHDWITERGQASSKYYRRKERYGVVSTALAVCTTNTHSIATKEVPLEPKQSTCHPISSNQVTVHIPKVKNTPDPTSATSTKVRSCLYRVPKAGCPEEQAVYTVYDYEGTGKAICHGRASTLSHIPRNRPPSNEQTDDQEDAGGVRNVNAKAQNVVRLQLQTGIAPTQASVRYSPTLFETRLYRSVFSWLDTVRIVMFLHMPRNKSIASLLEACFVISSVCVSNVCILYKHFCWWYTLQCCRGNVYTTQFVYSSDQIKRRNAVGTLNTPVEQCVIQSRVDKSTSLTPSFCQQKKKGVSKIA